MYESETTACGSAVLIPLIDADPSSFCLDTKGTNPDRRESMNTAENKY